MKATSKRWVIGKVNPVSGEVDQFVEASLLGYTPRLDCAHTYSERHIAENSIKSAGEEGEVVLEATVTVEVKV